MNGRRTILIGQAPSRNGGLPLWGRVGRRIAALAGLTFEEYLSATERHNLLGTWPGKNGKGDCFPAEMAKKRAKMLEPILGGQRVIFLGRAVALAFGFDAEPLRWKDRGWYDAAILPHPSGINRWWNDPKNQRLAKRFLRGALR